MTTELASTYLQWPDYVVIAVYFVVVLAIGLWSGRTSKQDSVSGYFLASRNMHFIPVGASLFASNIGSGHFVGLAGSGAAAGIGNGAFELNAMLVLLLLGYVFVPVYMASGVYTMPEYLRKRFGGQRIRVYLSVLALILYVFTKISADLFSGAIFMKQAIGLEGDAGLYLSIMVLLAIAALFTITGGLTAVIWTDTIQTVIMLIGAFILMGMSFSEVGGYNELIRKFFQAYPSENYTAYDSNNQSCARIPKDSMHLFRSMVPGESDLPWTGVVFGVTISAVWYWCSDQVIVQRTLASKTVSHAKAGCILASYLKLLPMFIIIFPGMASRVLYTDRVACAHPDRCREICGSESGCSNIAYAELVIKLMPPGLTGLMLAVMLAALMSSLTSIFNSSSTIFTMDVWTRIRNKPSDMELLIVGRAFVLVLVAVSIMWIPMIQAAQGSQLFIYIQNVTSYLSPPVCAVYVLAIFVPRVNEKGAFWGLMIGLIIGLVRFGLEFGYTIPACGTGLPDTRPEIIKRLVGDIHYLHFGCILFVITLIVTVVVSLLTEPMDPDYLHRLTFWTRYSTEIRRNIDDEEEDETERKQPIDGHKQEMIQENEVELPAWRRAVNCLCGLQTQQAQESNVDSQIIKLTPQEEAIQAAESIIEDPFWSRVVNANAVLLMSTAAFIWAWYA